MCAGLQEAFYGKEVIVADREMVECAAEDILRGADTADVAFLVVGDPFGCAGPCQLCSFDTFDINARALTLGRAPAQRALC